MVNKKIYHAPSAEALLLAPCENIASWTVGNGHGWWNDTSAWWGKIPVGASIITGTLSLPDDDGNSWTLPDTNK